MGGTTIERPEEEEITRLPIAIIPTRIEAMDEQRRELEQGLDEVLGEISALQDHARTLTVRPDDATIEYINSEVERTEETLEQVRLRVTALPILGERYTDELDLVQQILNDARTTGGEGNIAASFHMITRSRAMLRTVGDVFDIELHMLTGGMPENIQIPGVESEDALETIFDSLEASVLDIATTNHGRAEAVLKAGRLYVENIPIYNIDNSAVEMERNALFGFIVERGNQGRQRIGYTSEQEHEDRQSLWSFEANIGTIKDQWTEINTTVFSQWRDEIALAIEQQTNEQMRQQMENLRHELDEIIRRLEQGQIIGQLEFERITTSYFMTIGREMPLSEEERDANLTMIATSLRGTGRVTEESPEWYGQQALDALQRGDRNLAALAISLGLLERSARQLDRHAVDYLPSYQTIYNIIIEGRSPTSSMLAQYSTEMDMAHMLVDIEGFQAITGRRGQERRELIRNAAAIADERFKLGDFEGARRLLYMISFYYDRNEGHRWGDWEGRETIEQALQSEMAGEDASEQFNIGMIYHQVRGETDQFRELIENWSSRRMTFQIGIVNQTLERAEELARQGNAQEAARVLTLLAMYVDSVQRLGVVSNGRVTRITDENAIHLSGMETQLQAMAQGEPGDDGAFMESFNLAQIVYIEAEANRLETFAQRRGVGRTTINEALGIVRERVEAGDYRGANLLLQYIRDYYGAAEGGREEGWRYELFTHERMIREGTEEVPYGYRRGRRIMLEAIEMEMHAGTDEEHYAAAQQFDRGTRRIVQTEMLIADYNRLTGIYWGREPIAEGVEAGQIPLGERNEDGTFPAYVTAEQIRGYERSHGERDLTIARDYPLHSLRSDLEELREAAFSGNLREYEQASETYWNRLSLIATRVHRRSTVVDAEVILRQGNDALTEAFRAYVINMCGGGTTGERAWQTAWDYGHDVGAFTTTSNGLSLMADYIEQHPETFGAVSDLEMGRLRQVIYLSTEVDALLTQMDGIEYTTDDLPIYGEGLRGGTVMSYLLELVQGESRAAMAYSQIGQQIEVNDEYLRMIRIGGGDRFSLAEDNLRDCNTDLQRAQNLILEGRFQEAEEAYEAAIDHRITAMASYEGRSAMNLTATGIENFLEGAERLGEAIFFPEDFAEFMRSEPDRSYWDAYREMQTDSMHYILFGRGGSGSQERMQLDLNGARIVEASIFAIPADSGSQMFAEYAVDQGNVYALVGMGRFDDANAIIDRMQERVADHQFWTTVGLTAVGVVACLVPGGQLFGGSLFATMAFDQIVTEYRVQGEASWTSWLMFGGIIATMGIGGLAGVLRTEAQFAQGTAYATRMTQVVRALNYTNIGIGVGFSGYMGYHAVDAFSEGNMREGIFLTAMAAFPWAHMAGSRGWQAMRARPVRGTTEARTETELVAEEIRAPEPREVPIEIEPNEIPSVREAQRLRTPEEMFEFMRELRSEDPTVRDGAQARLRTLPEEVQGRIMQFMETGSIGNTSFMHVPEALVTGEMTPLARGNMTSVIDMIFRGPEPPTPGPRGGRPVTEVESTGTLQPGRLDWLLEGLLTPEGTTARENVVHRAAAQQTLENIRAENPEVAEIIDGLIRNPSVRHYFETGEATPFSQRALENARSQIEAMFEPEAVAMAVNDYNYYIEDVVASEMARRPHLVEGEGPMMIRQMPEVRAMAEEGGARPPGVQQGGIGPVDTTVGGGQGGGGGPVRPIPEVRWGRFERMYRFGRERWQNWRSDRVERNARAELPEAEEVLSTTGEGVRNTLDMVLDPELAQLEISRARTRATELEVRVEELREGGARPEEIRVAEQEAQTARTEAVELENLLNSSPQRIADIMKSLYDTAQTARGETSGYWNLLRRIYSRPNVRAQLETLAETDPVLRDILNRTGRTIESGARNAGISPEDYMAVQAREGFSANDVEVMIRAIEAQRGELAPLLRTQELLGIEYTPLERASLLPRLEGSDIIPPQMLVRELAGVQNSVEGRIREIPIADEPVTNVIRRTLLERSSQGGNVNDVLTEILRSPEVERAVRERYGREAAEIYRDAVQNNRTVDEILNVLEQGRAVEGAEPQFVPREMRTPLEGFVRNISQDPAFAQEFSAINALRPRINQVLDQASTAADVFARDTRPLRDDAINIGWRILRFLNNWEPLTNWGARRFVNSIRNAVPGGRIRAGLRNSPYLIPQAIAWYVIGNYAWDNVLLPWYNSLNSAGSVEEGRRLCERDFGNLCAGASDEDLEWLATEEGRRFFFHMPNALPRGRDRRPGNVEDLNQLLQRTDILIEPRRLGEIVADGREMGGRLDDINDLLSDMRRGDAEDRREAELAAILEPWGLTVDDVQGILSQERKEEVDITDLFDLRIPQWRERGLVIDFRDAVADAFCVDTGLISEGEAESGRYTREGGQRVDFLTSNTDVFAYLWEAVQGGHIPSVYLDNIMNDLTSEGRITELRQQVTSERDIYQVLEAHLRSQNLYIEVIEEDGTVTGIRQNSFLGLLDVRASLDPGFRDTYEQLLNQYRENNEALLAFNAFNIEDIRYGEENRVIGGDAIYGNPQELAALILESETPGEAVEAARQRGFVGSAVLGYMEPRLFDPENAHLVTFIAERSDEERLGFVRWLLDHRDNIRGHVLEIIEDASQHSTVPGPGRYTEIYEYLDRRATVYRSNGWWDGATPAEEQAREERERSRGTVTREETVEPVGEEFEAQYVRRPGFEVMTPRREDQIDVEEVHAPPATLSPEAQRFYANEESTLTPLLDGTIDRMIEARNDDGTLTEDAQAMVNAYGPEINSEDAETRERARDVVRADIKAEMYRLLTSTIDRDMQLREGYGLTVSGEGEGLSVEVDRRTARNGLRNHIMQYVSRRGER
ncbi:hypothetical protein KKB44_03060 [Candidatus Micrarchaeota archaeon]|nr:hypothetical protein [Candidatus Micrarchaeota archaeon]